MNSKTLGNKNSDIVFLHGWGGNASAFLFVAKRLSKQYRCTVLDFAGFGQTPEPERAYTVRDYANEVIEMMDEKGIEKAVLVGHSFGGRVALELASTYPQRVTKIALVDSAGLKPRRKPSYYVRVFLHKLLKKLGLKGLGGSSDYKKLSPIMKETFRNVVNYDQTPLLSGIAQPVAVFWGKEDTETPPYMAKRFRKRIANSEIFWLNGGHFAYIDDFNRFYPILSAFLREDSGTQKTENYNGDGDDL